MVHRCVMVSFLPTLSTPTPSFLSGSDPARTLVKSSPWGSVPRTNQYPTSTSSLSQSHWDPKPGPSTFFPTPPYIPVLLQTFFPSYLLLEPHPAQLNGHRLPVRLLHSPRYLPDSRTLRHVLGPFPHGRNLNLFNPDGGGGRPVHWNPRSELTRRKVEGVEVLLPLLV